MSDLFRMPGSQECAILLPWCRVPVRNWGNQKFRAGGHPCCHMQWRLEHSASARGATADTAPGKLNLWAHGNHWYITVIFGGNSFYWENRLHISCQDLVTIQDYQVGRSLLFCSEGNPIFFSMSLYFPSPLLAWPRTAYCLECGFRTAEMAPRFALNDMLRSPEIKSCDSSLGVFMMPHLFPDGHLLCPIF